MIEEQIKEFAREYIDSCTKRAGFVILTENIKNDFIDLFVAGYMKCMESNTDRPKWHNLRKNPNDLPNDDRIVSDQEGNNVRYVKHLNKWFYRHRTCEANVIAWCEIPKYTEE